MTDAETLHKLLNPAIFVAKESDHTTKKLVCLCESKAKNSAVTIKQLPEDMIILKIDEFQFTRKPDKKEIGITKEDHARACSVFIGNYGENCTADYIMIVPKDKLIIYIEMKSSGSSEKHIIKQLHGAKCFIECMKLYVKHFILENESFLHNYQERFVKLMFTDSKHYAKDSSRRARPTRPNIHPPVPDTPEKAYRVEKKVVVYDQIAWRKHH